MNKIVFTLLLSFILIAGCKTLMSEVQEDVSNKLTQFTQCPEQIVFKHKLQEIKIDEQLHFAIHEEDFDYLEKYLLGLEDCSQKRLLDIIARNKIIQELLRN